MSDADAQYAGIVGATGALGRRYEGRRLQRAPTPAAARPLGLRPPTAYRQRLPPDFACYTPRSASGVRPAEGTL